MARCKRCLLPDRVPGARLDACGVCAFCREQGASRDEAEERQRRLWEADLEQALRAARGQGSHDCVVCLSGGKDSLYLAYKLKVEYGLKVLAFTCDLDIPAAGWENIQRTVKRLDLENVVLRPEMSFYRKFFRHLLTHQSALGAVRTVCYVSAPLTEGHALALATERRIPLVLAGYSPGQPEPDWMRYEMAPEKIRACDWTPEILRRSGLFSTRELGNFWNPRRFGPEARFPRFLAPFHAWPYHQSEVMRKVADLGLTARRGKAHPIRTNSPFQWLLMYSDLKHLGYNPYAPEFCRLIRQGKASRFRWRVLFPLVDFMLRHRVGWGRQVTATSRWLGLELDELAMSVPEANASPVQGGPLQVAPRERTKGPSLQEVAYEPAASRRP